MDSPILAVLSGAQQGASYGARIRLPHALVMTFLFQKGTLQMKLRRIIEVAFEHVLRFETVFNFTPRGFAIR